MEIPLFDNYYLVPSNYDKEFHAFVTAHLHAMYANEYMMNLDAVLTEKEKTCQKELSKNIGKPFQLNFYVCNGKDKIGWCYGNQTDYETFYLANTAILEEHRRKGIGSAILQTVLKVLEERGFQKVYSSHAATNNSVIVPMLRAGFLITGFEISDVDGLMVKLTYFFNETRRKVVDFRVGKSNLTPEIAKALSLKIT